MADSPLFGRVALIGIGLIGSSLARAMRPGGRIVVIDFHKKALPVGPPVHAKLTPDEVTAEFQAAGFRLVRQLDFLPYQYFLVFQR